MVIYNCSCGHIQAIAASDPHLCPACERRTEMADQPAEAIIYDRIRELLILMRDHKPGDLSEADRLWAIAITEVEKLLAFWMYVSGECIRHGVVSKTKEKEG
jgi:hypothetical protein